MKSICRIPLRGYSQDWCVRGARCALQTDGDWGQCIMCHEKRALACESKFVLIFLRKNRILFRGGGDSPNLP